MSEQKEFYIAGVQFRPKVDIKEALDRLKDGDKLYLEPEPSNKFDPNAIKIESLGDHETTDDIFLGYVPKKFSSEISGLLEIDVALECILTTLSKTGKPWEMFKVTVKEMEEE